MTPPLIKRLFAEVNDYRVKWYLQIVASKQPPADHLHVTPTGITPGHKATSDQSVLYKA